MKISLALATVVCLAPSLSAAIITYRGTLSGSNEVPPTPSAATGTATVIVDTIANTINLSVIFSNLTTPDTAAHIHCCTTPTAGVATAIPAWAGFPLGVTSGSFINQSFSLLDSSFWNPAFITANGGTTAGAEAALLGGLATGAAYLNVHSSQFPGGEIRANLVAIPESSTFAMMGLSFIALALARRRLSS